jgi:hypothetical protein
MHHLDVLLDEFPELVFFTRGDTLSKLLFGTLNDLMHYIVLFRGLRGFYHLVSNDLLLTK